MVNRAWSAAVEANVLSFTQTLPGAYGLALGLDSVGNVDLIGPAIPHATVSVRPFPTQSARILLGTSTPPTSGIVDVLKQGYMTVLLGGTQAAVRGGPVYIWTAASSGSHVRGQVEAANPSSSGIQITNAYFMGPADASGNIEIAFNLFGVA